MKAVSKRFCQAATMTTSTSSSSSSLNMMPIQKIVSHGVTHPFGDHRSVHQAFPAGIDTVDADPFLMCDYFNMIEQNGPAKHADDFPVNWHPHRGFDICSYLRSGTGRHGDSLGNRETFATPGMQWMSTGSGVEHAEGGATPAGTRVQGFQIWVNVPALEKMKPPRYGTVPTEKLPLVQLNEKVQARILAGSLGEQHGPFETVQPVQMIDFEVLPGGEFSFDVTGGLDTAMLYVYEGSLRVNQESMVAEGNVVLLNATRSTHREIALQADSDGKALLFAGKKLKQPIAWHGPIVMNTQQQVRETLRELQSGQFPPVRVDWDYKRIAAKPKDEL